MLSESRTAWLSRLAHLPAIRSFIRLRIPMSVLLGCTRKDSIQPFWPLSSLLGLNSSPSLVLPLLCSLPSLGYGSSDWVTCPSKHFLLAGGEDLRCENQNADPNLHQRLPLGIPLRQTGDEHLKSGRDSIYF